ncbi:hypothetical protein [Dyadobacter fermentans]|uniref:Uncharacterized protein n=1 Tax=Dyadobacter fermentans (strain ATCC 700827 / DSM 18053 / CIP 107007 / KCTC 52180 / NS114) TaxID=471854 RepID=C6VZF5_DYAFD|nr:hypothetical protein [Dyadobacter fermentans]ACT91767.1 hypothetical protein Dfer_0498 [Dyadobacter fermentans DSM 18053]
MDGLQSFLEIGAFIIAALTLYKAISEYSKNNVFKRASVLEELIVKFKKPELFAAKRLLDDFQEYHYKGMSSGAQYDPTQVSDPVIFVHANYKSQKCVAERIEKGKDIFRIFIDKDLPIEKTPGPDTSVFYANQNFPGAHKYVFINLAYLLRNHESDIINDNEIFFRDSFDELLDFTLLLIYYLRNEIITIREVQAHFAFYLKKVKHSKPVLQYISIYYNSEDFDWLFRQLPSKADSILYTDWSSDELEE